MNVLSVIRVKWRLVDLKMQSFSEVLEESLVAQSVCNFAIFVEK